MTESYKGHQRKEQNSHMSAISPPQSKCKAHTHSDAWELEMSELQVRQVLLAWFQAGCRRFCLFVWPKTEMSYYNDTPL